MDNIINIFRNGVPSTKQLYSKYSIVDGLTYKKFKKSFIVVTELKKCFLDMNKYDYLTRKEIHNIFKYLSKLKFNKFFDVKRIINILNDTSKLLREKINKIDDEIELYECIKHILYHIDILKHVISDNINMEYNDLENIILFENTTYTILKSNNINNSLKLVFSNLELLGSTLDYKGRDFSTLLYNALLNVKNNNKKDRISYYNELLRYILNIKCLHLDKEKFYEILNIKVYINSDMLEEKIKNLKYDAQEDRYIIDKDYTVTIDNANKIDKNGNIINPSTKMMDDALSIDKTINNTYILGIHIADVYSLNNFKYDNINKCIKQNSVGTNKIRASLIEQVNRNAISLFIEIDANGMIIDYKLLKTRLEVSKNLVYDDVSKIIMKDDVDINLRNTIIKLSELYNVICNKNFYEYPTIENIGHSLVKKYMILYGCIISEYFNRYNIPGIYLCGTERNNYYSTKANCYESGFNSYEYYSKSTSPLYDKSSVLCQFLLHEFFFNRDIYKDKDLVLSYLNTQVDILNKKH